MPKGRVNFRLIKLHRSYAIEEAALVLGVHQRTVRNWIDKGLPVLASKRPTLILGTDLRTFLDTGGASSPSGHAGPERYSA